MSEIAKANFYNAIDESIDKRARMMFKCMEEDEDGKFKKLLISMCRDNIVFFFVNFVYTDRSRHIPAKFGNAIPFLPFQYQEDFLLDAWDCIENGQKPVESRAIYDNGVIVPTNMFSEKSRQM